MLDGYVRVSRVGGRSGESYISPDVQREKIEGYAKLHELKLDEVVTEEDVSGAKNVDDRELGRLIRKCENGESEGVIVYRLDRFGRNALEVLKAVRRLNDAGACLVGVSDGVDSTQPSGKLVIAVLAALAEEQWDRSREGWRESVRRAVVERGIHIATNTPLGYRRRDEVAPEYDDKGRLKKNGRLVPDPEVGPLVRDVFKLRAEGNSWAKCTDYLAEHGVKLERTSLGTILRNRVYLGEARGQWGAVNPNAHEPLVTQAEWDAVALVWGEKFRQNGSLKGVGLLKGIVRCANCGYTLQVQPSRGEPRYYCRQCRPGASAYVSRLDDYVTDRLDELVRANDPRIIRALERDERYEAAVEEVSRAQADLDGFIEVANVALVGKDSFRRGVEVRKAKLEEARRALRELPRPEPVAQAAEFKADGDWYREFFQRPLLRRLIAECTLRPSSARGKAAPPIADRLTLRFIDDESAERAATGRRQRATPTGRLREAAPDTGNSGSETRAEAPESPSEPAKSRSRVTRRRTSKSAAKDD